MLTTISETATLHSRKESNLCGGRKNSILWGVLRQTFFHLKDVVKQSLHEAFHSVTKLLQLEKISMYMCRGCLFQNELQGKLS